MSKKNLLPSCTPSEKYPQRKVILIFLFAFISVSIVIPLYFILFSTNTNGRSGFPFDDAFIHLTFAKNLFQFFSFSYFKNEMITSGSSSPLFTFLLVPGTGIIKNEFVLAYLPGMIFFSMLICFFYKVSLLEFKPNFYFVIVTVLIMALDKWTVFFSVSGMETTLFACVLIASVYFYRSHNINRLIVALSLLIWIRLEGMIFIAAMLADYLICAIFYKKKSLEEIKGINYLNLLKMILPVTLSVALYILMNFYLSGSIFPNTFYAKKTFYSPEFMSREYFLQSEVMDLFLNGSYKILFSGFIISLIILFSDILKRKRNSNLLYFIFLFLLIFSYWYEMPYAGLHDRYLIPLIPFYILLSMSGFFYLFLLAKKYFRNDSVINFAFYFLFLLIFYYAGLDLQSNLTLYTEECDYIERTHIKPAKWILQNTDPGDIVATHEIGAIGYYSERRLVDIAGLVTPELIDKLSDKNYISEMQQYLDKRNVKYFAALSSWCKVVNANPVYSGKVTDQIRETFDIYKYDHDEIAGIHFPSKEVNRLIVIADYNLKKNLPLKAINFLNMAIELDSNCSLSFYLKADACLKAGDKKSYESCLRRAVDIFPDYSTAKSRLVNYYRSENKPSEAEKITSSHNSFLMPEQHF